MKLSAFKGLQLSDNLQKKKKKKKKKRNSTDNVWQKSRLKTLYENYERSLCSVHYALKIWNP